MPAPFASSPNRPPRSVHSMSLSADSSPRSSSMSKSTVASPRKGFLSSVTRLFEKKTATVAPSMSNADASSYFYFQMTGGKEAIAERIMQDLVNEEHKLRSMMVALFAKLVSTPGLKQLENGVAELINISQPIGVVRTAVEMLPIASKITTLFLTGAFASHESIWTDASAQLGASITADHFFAPTRLLGHIRHFAYMMATRGDSILSRRKSWEQICKDADNGLRSALDRSQADLDNFAKIVALEEKIGVAEGAVSVVVAQANEKEDAVERICVQLTRPRPSDFRGLAQPVIAESRIRMLRDGEPDSLFAVLGDAVVLAKPQSAASFMFKNKNSQATVLRYAPFARNDLEFSDLGDSLGLRVMSTGFVQPIFPTDNKAGLIQKLQSGGYPVSSPVAENAEIISQTIMEQAGMSILLSSAKKEGYAVLDADVAERTFPGQAVKPWLNLAREGLNEYVAYYPLKKLYVKEQKEGQWTAMPESKAVVYMTPQGTYFVSFVDLATQWVRFSVNMPPAKGVIEKDSRFTLFAHDTRQGKPADAPDMAMISVVFQADEDQKQFSDMCKGDFTEFANYKEQVLTRFEANRTDFEEKLMKQRMAYSTDRIMRTTGSEESLAVASSSSSGRTGNNVAQEKPRMMVPALWKSSVVVKDEIVEEKAGEEEKQEESVLFGGAATTSAALFGDDEDGEEEAGLFGTSSIAAVAPAPVAFPAMGSLFASLPPAPAVMTAESQGSILFGTSDEVAEHDLFGEQDEQVEEQEEIPESVLFPVEMPALNFAAPEASQLVATEVEPVASQEIQMIDTADDIEETEIAERSFEAGRPLAFALNEAASALTLEASAEIYIDDSQIVEGPVFENELDMRRNNLKRVERVPRTGKLEIGDVRARETVEEVRNKFANLRTQIREVEVEKDKAVKELGKITTERDELKRLNAENHTLIWDLRQENENLKTQVDQLQTMQASESRVRQAADLRATSA